MLKGALLVLVVVVGMGIFIWASDRVTLEGERTVYTATCEGVWVGLHCTGRLTAGDRYRFRSSRSRNEIVYWIAGSKSPSGKFTECQITDRDQWDCAALIGEVPTITHQMNDGRPSQHLGGIDIPFHAVNKWKWWAMHWGLHMFSNADYSSDNNPRERKHALPPPPPPEKRK